MSTCSRCQKSFECGMVEATDNPCLCPDCLKARIAELAAAAPG